MKTAWKVSFLAVGAVALCSLALSVMAAEFEKNLEKDFEVKTPGRLKIEADRGSITIKIGSSDKLHVRVLRKVKNGTQSQADALFAEHEVKFSQTGDTILVLARNKHHQWIWHSGQPQLDVRFEAEVPKAFSVELATAGGDIRVPDLNGDAQTKTSSGAIQLGHIQGKVEASDAGGDVTIASGGGEIRAHTSSGAIRIGKAAGAVEAGDSGGDIEIQEAGGNVEAHTSSGHVKLGNVQGRALVKNSGGDITVGPVETGADLQTSSGSIHLERGKGAVYLTDSGGSISAGEVDGPVTAQTSSGSIRIQSAHGEILARDSGGDIEIGEGQGQITAQTSSGSIKISAARGTVHAKNSGGDIRIGRAVDVEAHTTSGSIELGRAEGNVTATDAGGSIKVKEVLGRVELATSSGEISVGFVNVPTAGSTVSVSGGGITVNLPKNSALNLDAQANGGAVKSDLPVSVTESHRGESRLVGAINGGGPGLVLRSSAGDIHVRASKPVQKMELEESTR